MIEILKGINHAGPSWKETIGLIVLSIIGIGLMVQGLHLLVREHICREGPHGTAQPRERER